MKAIDQKLEYPHCVYNDKGEAQVVNSLEEHEALEIHPKKGGVWMPNALRRKGGKVEAPKAEAAPEAEEPAEESEAEAKPRRGRRSAK